MGTGSTRAIKLFYCYAHEDKELRDSLEQHLSSLKRQGQITSWSDSEVSPGMDWEHEIDIQLNTADLILLLISPPFIASEYCYTVEMQRALERHQSGTARVIPILLRSVDWEDERFSRLQMLPTDGRPVKLWSDQDAAFTDIAKGIRRVVKELGGTAKMVGSPMAVLQDSDRAEEFAILAREKNVPRLSDGNEQPAILLDPGTVLRPLRTFGGPLRIVSSVHYFPGERTVKYIQHSRYVLWKNLALPILLLVLVLLVAIILPGLGMLPQSFFLSWWFIMSLVVISLLITIFLVVTSYFDDIYILTNRRIIEIKRRLLTYGVGLEVSYQDICEIHEIQVKVPGIIEFFFDIGDLRLETHDPYPNITLYGVDHPFVLQDLIASIKNYS
jgi:TIR domain